MRFRKELVGAAVNMLALKVVSREPMHGYEIVRRVNALSDGALEWREGAIYPVLHKLELSGLIESRWMEGDTGKQRRVYSISRDGKAALSQYSSEWTRYTVAVNRVLEAPRACA